MRNSGGAKPWRTQHGSPGPYSWGWRTRRYKSQHLGERHPAFYTPTGHISVPEGFAESLADSSQRQLQPKVAVRANRWPHHKSQCVNNQTHTLYRCGERDNFVGLATFTKSTHLNISKLQLRIVATELHKAKKLRIYTVNTQRAAHEEVYVNGKS